MWCADPVLCLYTACVTRVRAGIFFLRVYLVLRACRMHAVHKDGSEAGGEGE